MSRWPTMRDSLPGRVLLRVYAVPTLDRRFSGGRSWKLPGGFWLSAADVEFLTGAALWEIDEAAVLEVTIRRGGGGDFRGLRADWRPMGDEWLLYFCDASSHVYGLTDAFFADPSFERIRDEPKLMVEARLLGGEPAGAAEDGP